MEPLSIVPDMFYSLCEKSRFCEKSHVKLRCMLQPSSSSHPAKARMGTGSQEMMGQVALIKSEKRGAFGWRNTGRD